MIQQRPWYGWAAILAAVILALAPSPAAAAPASGESAAPAEATPAAPAAAAQPTPAQGTDAQPAETDEGAMSQAASGAKGTTAHGENPSGAGGEASGGEEHTYSPHLAWVMPFIALLALIALAPLIHAEWWEHRYPWAAAILFSIGLFYYAAIRQDLWPWLHEMREYVSFIALLFALFVVSGGIAIHVSRKATPAANVVLLLTGAVVANIFGTTGAAMLLIRPYIRINRKHIKPYHICFFIFMVANVGGCLTPVGDPPLFLGYLKGVPFIWVLEHCWRPWVMAIVILTAIFYFIDKRDHAKEDRHDWGEHDTGPAVRINGIHNFLLILVVVAAVFQVSVFDAVSAVIQHGISVMGLVRIVFSREILMVATGVVSQLITHKSIFEINEFTHAPILEVAILFLAIFSTMVPALEWLDANAHKLPLHTPGQFYFTTGGLSCVLDNAPTYLTFLQTRLGELDPAHVEQARQALGRIHDNYVSNPKTPITIPTDVTTPEVRGAIDGMLRYHRRDIQTGEFDDAEVKVAFLVGNPGMNVYLVAISVGAVFFGAFTYIGNAPNFMVKSIAESSGIQMPSFLGYVFKYALPILLPTYLLVWLVFFLGHG